MCPDAVFPPILLVGKRSEEVRTTHGPESFHRHNSQSYTSHPSTREVINKTPKVKLI